jgi:hypothetical protein
VENYSKKSIGGMIYIERRGKRKGRLFDWGEYFGEQIESGGEISLMGRSIDPIHYIEDASRGEGWKNELHIHGMGELPKLDDFFLSIH